MKKKVIIVLSALAVVGAALGLYIFQGGNGREVSYKTVKAERGSIVSVVSATGTLNAVKNVLVGTQVSGMIRELYADFNSPVKKGQPIAQIDQALFQAQVDQSNGAYLTAKANLEKAAVTIEDTRRTLNRHKKLVSDGVLAQSDFDTSQTAYDTALASRKAAKAAVIQTRGAYDQALTNLGYTTIRSPVDGIVVSRNVDVGQTVAASFQTPTLFTIAQDLTKMEIDTSVDEADVSKIKEGQKATFTVDAYPEVRFKGVVEQVRNAPTVAQNVVTYIVVINVDNTDLRLKPGMTANVTFETARKDNVLGIPTAALRFRPREGTEVRRGGAPDGDEKDKEAQPGRKTVFVLGADGKPVPVRIRTGVGNDRRIEITEGGVKENDEVIVDQVTPKKKASLTSGGPPGPRF